MADRRRPELDLGMATEVEERLPNVLEPVFPASRNAIVSLAPAELVHEPPSPQAPVREHEILHVQVSLAIVGVLLDVQEVGAIVGQYRRDIRGHQRIPTDVFLRRDGLESARRIVFALRSIRW